MMSVISGGGWDMSGVVEEEKKEQESWFRALDWNLQLPALTLFCFFFLPLFCLFLTSALSFKF